MMDWKDPDKSLRIECIAEYNDNVDFTVKCT